MAELSIIIPVYNKRDFLPACVQSIQDQDFDDFEIVIVDDGSSDNSLNVAYEMANRDSRIKVIALEQNCGTLIARKRGIESSTGKYVTFIDPDDEFTQGVLSKLMNEVHLSDVDILHFGIKVVADTLEEKTVAGMESFMNPIPRTLCSPEILRIAFGQNGFDWNLAHKIFRGSLIRGITEYIDEQYLVRSEDLYTFFVIAYFAKSYKALANSQYYIYHLDRGVSSIDSLSAKDYEYICQQDSMADSLCMDFINKTDNDAVELTEVYHAIHKKLVQHSLNEWNDCVDLSLKKEAIAYAQEHFTDSDIYWELYRYLRDATYKTFHELTSGKQLHDIDDNLQLIDLYKELIKQIDISKVVYVDRQSVENRSLAIQHSKDLERAMIQREKISAYSNQPIRIFVTTHKEVDIPDGSILQPVQVGSKTQRLSWALQDDAGENIADKNPMYCELTTQYWAWKNVDADYYGFCHYRRYFNFSSTDYKENAYGEIMDDYIDAKAIAKYGLDDETIRNSIEGYDVITTRFGDLRKIIEGHGTPKEVWEAAPKLIDEDLHRMYDIVCELQPAYKQDAIAFLNGHQSCFCNMFIMRKEIFQDYCEWLFPLLEEFERRTDMSRYSKEALRTPGHLAERLLNIYLLHHKRIGAGWKTKELQCVHFTSPAPQEQIEELLTVDNPASIVPVVFAADDNYVPQLATTMYSAMANADSSRFYDVVVLQSNITWAKQQRLKEFFKKQFDNMELRFINVDRLVSGVELSTNNEHISVETYYRFLIQEVLPFYDKVLYLDSDIVINGNIAELFDTQLGDNLLAAVRDIDFLGNLNMKDGNRLEYNREVLGMKNPYEYFQAGVLVLNTKAMREQYSITQWLEFASNPDYIYNDQDVLNVCCEGRVEYLDWNWNVMHDCANRVANVFSYAPNSAFDAYQASRQNPLIIHYAGFEKPWKNPDCDFASYYWRYARQTPFYERLLKKIEHENFRPASKRQILHENAIGEQNPLRKVIDPIAPLGSPQREAAKAIVRKLRGRK
ncbi:hypothetical protein GCM10007377_09770 [Galliscardovia ingluviei]|uniref:DUF4422 domain-containing protein n=1 Tax=Galliscardovia ingluviei TaxID=1769422 RepID=A0A8J3AJZ2_9BIFI|nr:DUF4422 domain-containing protein [Galliscardovia ingluviei]GGI14205.1 hypothetical protein GCM10007377_09770 [Galliscardovia ingluviei]